MKVTVNAVEYRIANGGKNPRGRGSWAFGPRRNASVEQVVFFNGSYADAKAKAVAFFAAKHVADVFVQS